MDKESKRISTEAEIGIGGGSAQSSVVPFVSVMLLNYSHGDLLVRALEACAAQTFRDFEIVMINNAAIDNTQQVYRDFCTRHPDIKTTYVHVTHNLGAVHGRNEGLKYARGEYVMFHDSDDWMEPDCLERLARAARETGADRVSGQFQDVLPGNRIARVRKFSHKTAIPTLMLQGAIFRNSIIMQNHLYFDETLDNSNTTFDVWYSFRFAAFEEKGDAIVNHTVYNYLINPTSVSNSQLKWDIDWWFRQWVQAPVEYLLDLKAAIEDKKILNEAEYLIVKSIYGYIMKAFRHQKEEDAKAFYRLAKAELEEKLPNWRKNPHVWPFGNGYELFDSLCLYALLWMDRLHMMGLIGFAGKMSKHLKFTR